MPVRHDVHRSCGSAFLADETASNRRPGQVLSQGIQSDVDHASIALGRTLDVAGHMTVGDPFRRGGFPMSGSSSCRACFQGATGWPQPPPALRPSLPPPGQRNAAAIPSIPIIATCSRKVLDRFAGHGASLSVNFGPSSNSVSTTSLRPNNEIPISPRTKRTVPATMSQCGYARNKAKAFVIFASFCLKTIGGSVYGPLPARHDNPLKVLAFPALATAFAFLQGFGAGNVSRRRLRF